MIRQTPDGGLRVTRLLGLVSYRYRKPERARLRTVLYGNEPCRLKFPPMVFCVARFGFIRALYALTPKNGDRPLTADTILYPMRGNSLSWDGIVCLGTRGQLLVDFCLRDPVSVYWNTSFSNGVGFDKECPLTPRGIKGFPMMLFLRLVMFLCFGIVIATATTELVALVIRLTTAL